MQSPSVMVKIIEKKNKNKNPHTPKVYLCPKGGKTQTIFTFKELKLKNEQIMVNFVTKLLTKG